MASAPEVAVPEKVGIRSEVVELLSNGRAIRAKFRIEGGRIPFPEGDWLKVQLSARVYDPSKVDQEPPRAEGPAIESTARTDWSMVDLPLPGMIRGQYSVCAKVYSADEKYRKLFDPSNCIVSRVTFGDLLRIDLTVLQDIYNRGGYGNPAAEHEIRRYVLAGVVVTEGDGGKLFTVSERDGKLLLSEPTGSPKK